MAQDIQFPEAGPVQDTYHPQDAIGTMIKDSLTVGGAGLFVAAVQNSVSKQNVGAFGIFSRFGGTSAMFGTFTNSPTV